MKLIIGAEIDGIVYEIFRPIRAKVQEAFNAIFEEKNYGTGIKNLSFTAIIRSDDALTDYPEVFKYSQKNKQCEYRVSIPLESFLSGNDSSRYTLICNALEKAITHLKNNAINLDVDNISYDFEKVRIKQNWK